MTDTELRCTTTIRWIVDVAALEFQDELDGHIKHIHHDRSHRHSGSVCPHASQRSGFGFMASSLQSAQADQANPALFPFGKRGHHASQPEESPQVPQYLADFFPVRIQ